MHFSSNNIDYEVTYEDGSYHFDPPAPEGVEGRMLRNLVDMVCSGRGPSLNTETARSAGIGTLDKQFKDDPSYLDVITKNSRRLGYNPKPTDVYMERLVRPGFKRGDPEAFVPAADATGHIKKVLQKRAHERDTRVKPKLGKDIIARFDKHYVATDTNMAKLPAAERQKVIIEKHAPKD